MGVEVADPGESVGGWLTGPLFHGADTGWALFVVALLLTFVYRRAAAAIALIACALSLPYLLYLAVPGALQLFGGPASAHTSLLNISHSASFLSLAATTYVFVRGSSATAGTGRAG
jgi:hypothetical protein